MIYKNNDIPQEYNKLAEISDNYLVWVNDSKLENGTKYSAYIQYINPSPFLLFTDDYQITKGTNYTLEAQYLSNGSGNYIDSYNLDFSLSTMTVDDDYISDGIYDRGDAPLIFICQFICCIFFVWMLNQLTKLIRKDGALH